MAARIDLTFDCADAARLAEFWKLALGYGDVPRRHRSPAERSGAAYLWHRMHQQSEASQETDIGCPLMPPAGRRIGVRGSMHTGDDTLPAPRRDRWP